MAEEKKKEVKKVVKEEAPKVKVLEDELGIQGVDELRGVLYEHADKKNYTETSRGRLRVKQGDQVLCLQKDVYVLGAEALEAGYKIVKGK